MYTFLLYLPIHIKTKFSTFRFKLKKFFFCPLSRLIFTLSVPLCVSSFAVVFVLILIRMRRLESLHKGSPLNNVFACYTRIVR